MPGPWVARQDNEHCLKPAEIITHNRCWEGQTDTQAVHNKLTSFAASSDFARSSASLTAFFPVFIMCFFSFSGSFFASAAALLASSATCAAIVRAIGSQRTRLHMCKSKKLEARERKRTVWLALSLCQHHSILQQPSRLPVQNAEAHRTISR